MDPMKRFRFQTKILILLFVLFLSSSCMPISQENHLAQSMTQPQSPAPSAESYQVSVWAMSLDSKIEQILLANQKLISEVNPVWVQLGANGDLHVSGASQATVSKLHEIGLRVVPSIQNSEFNREYVYDAIHDPASRAAHIDEIVQLVLENGCDGIDIDYESLAAEDREDYSRFMEELGVALHKHDKVLSTAVHPKTDENGSWDGPQAQDWARLGAAVDEFKIMTYDYHWATSEAGAIAPLDWVNQVLDYAATTVAPEKTYLGVHFYGYDWRGRNAEGLEWRQIQARLQSQNAEVQRNEAGEAWFQYDAGGNHTVYFTDAQALDERLSIRLAAHPQLAGIAIWRIGGEDPDNWAVIRKQLAKNK